jgi:type IX secretion system substrate protein
VRAQNLVPNYSFEDTIKCISTGGYFNGYVADWTGQVSGGGLWYFTANCNSEAGVPYNYISSTPAGFQYAHTGVSYAGIVTFVNGSSDTAYPYTGNGFKNVRNYIQAQLIQTLNAGKRYFVTFYVSLENYQVYACSDMGAYLSDSALKWVGGAKSYITPQIANDPKKQELTDTLNWMKITGSYIAKGGEQYIIIGNFKNDSASSIRYLGSIYSANSQAWYDIDDVIVSPDSNYADSLAGVNELKIKNYELKVFPNPSDGKFTIESSVVSHQSLVEIYNELGQKVAYTPLNLPQGRDFEIDLTSQPSGIYFYRVTTQQGELVGSGKLIINR